MPLRTEKECVYIYIITHVCSRIGDQAVHSGDSNNRFSRENPGKALGNVRYCNKLEGYYCSLSLTALKWTAEVLGRYGVLQEL